MEFASDNAGPAHPKVLEALIAANTGYAGGYGADSVTEAVQARIRDIFEAPEAAVYLVGTGTAANSLILATLANPWDTVFCTSMAHINEDECNAPEFFTGGTKLTLVKDADARMDPEALRAAIAAEESRGVHGPQRGPVSITQVTERGTVYSLDHIRAITGVARDFGLKTHLDGARFANALVALGCTPAEMTWKAGIDAVSFGGTKNGCLGVEACIFFEPAKAWEFELRRKRGAHLFSKHRYLAAQMQAYLRDDLWLDNARAANTAAARLAAGFAAHPQVTLAHPAEANIVFARFPRHLHAKMQRAGAHYYVWDGDPFSGDPEEQLMGRFVCDWSADPAETDRFLELLAQG
ncbi:threonine aldolase family protein [Marivivens marinus]|uniref:threonine aldolase family protein n=1 Tax=Marivivens marinus TaxID=3110173 RepID=UPI003B846604